MYISGCRNKKNRSFKPFSVGKLATFRKIGIDVQTALILCELVKSFEMGNVAVFQRGFVFLWRKKANCIVKYFCHSENSIIFVMKIATKKGAECMHNQPLFYFSTKPSFSLPISIGEKSASLRMNFGFNSK